jgi:hypothetical protein
MQIFKRHLIGKRRYQVQKSARKSSHPSIYLCMLKAATKQRLLKALHVEEDLACSVKLSDSAVIACSFEWCV